MSTIYLWRAVSTDGNWHVYEFTLQPLAPAPRGVVGADVFGPERVFPSWDLAGACHGELTDSGGIDTGDAIYTAPQCGALGLYNDRINVFIDRVVLDAHQPEPPYTFTGTVALVRDRYRPLEDGEGSGAPVRVVIRCGERWDESAINNLGQPGAFVADLDPERVEAAVAELRAAWPAALVQDGSGRFEHLATVPWGRAW